MRFEIVTRQFEIEDGTFGKLYKRLHLLERPLERYQHFEKKGDVILEHRPRKHEYEARIHLRLPKHEISASANGFTLEGALHKAALGARERIIKIKEKQKFS